MPKEKITKADLTRLCKARNELDNLIAQHKGEGGSQTLLETLTKQKTEYDRQIADATTTWLGIKTQT